jgi:hypothetical protein
MRYTEAIFIAEREAAKRSGAADGHNDICQVTQRALPGRTMWISLSHNTSLTPSKNCVENKPRMVTGDSLYPIMHRQVCYSTNDTKKSSEMSRATYGRSSFPG